MILKFFERVLAADPGQQRLNSEYEDGYQAAKDGKEIWENPHSSPSGGRNSFNQWMAGWCFGKKCGS